MRVRVLFFGPYRDLAGGGELMLELPEASTVATAVRALRSRGDALAALPQAPSVAVNEEYTRLDAPLAEGDEIALLPPVAGG